MMNNTAEMVLRGIPKQVGSRKAKIKMKGMKDIDQSSKWNAI